MKFGVVGVIAFVIDYGLLALLTEAFGVNYLVSATISFTASVVFNYAASMRYVFTHKEGMSRRREFAIFVVLSVIGLGLNNGCMWAGVEFLGIHYLIVKIGATFIVMVWNFVTRKIFLDAGDEPGEMEYFTREDCVLAGANVVARIMGKLGCDVVEARRDGERATAGEAFFRVRGTAGDLHAAWKVCLNVFDHMSAVATKTRAMVDAAHAANPRCEVLTTRKSMPGAKDLLTEAVMAGGAFPHRLGLSETVLVFDHHLTFFGGFEAFVEQLPDIKGRCVEKKLFVEADAERARVLARAGVDGIQVDKVPVDELEPLVRELRAINPHVTLIAAGGVNPQNAGAYAATGVDGLATTAPFSAKPLDMSVRMRPL